MSTSTRGQRVFKCLWSIQVLYVSVELSYFKRADQQSSWRERSGYIGAIAWWIVLLHVVSSMSQHFFQWVSDEGLTPDYKHIDYLWAGVCMFCLCQDADHCTCVSMPSVYMWPTGSQYHTSTNSQDLLYGHNPACQQNMCMWWSLCDTQEALYYNTCITRFLLLFLFVSCRDWWSHKSASD